MMNTYDNQHREQQKLSENILKTKPLIAIVGPTAVGKTDISIKVAERLPVSTGIISADSMQVYKKMDIGTAKPSQEIRTKIPHYLVDNVEPDEEFSVGRYQKHAKSILNQLYQNKELPLLVGGTGLYVDALIYDFSMNELPKSTKYRQELQQKAEQDGLEQLYRKLEKVDPDAADRIHPNDQRRIIRALEVYYYTGEPISQRQKRRYDSPYNLLIFGITMDRNKLYNKIETRVDQMIDQGLVEEVKYLLENGYHLQLTSMQGLGYKEIAGYLMGDYDLETAVQKLKKNTKRFAKRQLSWFRRDPNIKWLDITETDKSEICDKIIDMILKEYLE
ncbi:tRNA (adenosine(37)-N6)-dimethylallyltransferase MiaA [Natranaerobius thermophilus]|uniref:tRNA dimethylallyltransferase n=1 Tax=Natranaerobius thermophilus (strain ATCC BAA-1301 / DSM 18059 / JW/NM-WN-LF) TaxID=457570 RepID=MIAA_NATTJ|nr:tRNA (adenosine(37)-N6)-dimethylallyltransferase MiaA [Natranaerobius thermophilus]B2A3X9.1 RecName: Full=tRNA dimethylallyltransferase; AltName: Full=Dimethylallyl diphosphate:tRNA dimethylallyltransferase; Short=DMAPP:tRNA dimethylallyltransferase; Short=DMATase; AltName: Full=Isopentenyl-diphosphate:tRNA isopentenyltransferase; Short=IPP transferase; Short=IPPT; Short=IPTase [Natranaerobius thermophilus JW/NM-WN-LF]ACB85081.1 tRNA delta(2)-isopentenylpyrophosphate transferase [Natranaerobiu